MASLTIKDYIALVRPMIRDTNGGAATPDPTQYIFQDWEIQSYIQMAVDTYTRYRKRRIPYTLTLQPGVSQYQLPSDWIKIDRDTFDQAIAPMPDVDMYQYVGYVMPTINGNPPLYQLGYDFYDSEQLLVVDPAPQVQANINIAYFATHTIDASGSTIPVQDKTYLAAEAASQALLALSVDRGTKMQKYKIGQGLSIDDSEVAKRLEEQADRLHEMFCNGIVMVPIGEAG